MKLIEAGVFARFVATYSAKSGPEDVLSAIDKAGDIVAVANTNIGRLQGDQVSEKAPDSAPQVEAAIGSIQSLFAKTGISIALCAEDHSYKDPAPVKPKLDPTAKLMKGTIREYEAGGDQEGADYLRANWQNKFARHANAKARYLQETARHANSILDMRRATSIILLADGGAQIPKPDLTVVERGMEYDPSSNTVRETDILGFGFSIKQRSALIAAYIFLSAAGGDQGGNCRVLVFFGEQHSDIFDYFEYFAAKSTAIPWIRGRKRNYGLIPSHVQ